MQELTDGAIWSESDHVPERFAVEGIAEGIMAEWLVPDPEQPATKQKPTNTKARYSVITASSLSPKPACGLMQARDPVNPTPSELSRGEPVHHQVKGSLPRQWDRDVGNRRLGRPRAAREHRCSRRRERR